MDSLEKNMIGKFSIREILEAFLEAGIWSSFPGSSRTIREESHVWTIRDWNDLPDSLISSAEMSDDCVSKFASLVRARN